MAVRFIPTGNLDVNTDPSRLPSQILGDGVEVSGAMTRCTNLVLDRPGVAETRPGSSKVNTVAIDQTAPHLLVEMAGARLVFSGTKTFYNEQIVEIGLTNARWTAFKYNAFNVTTQGIFASNGTERKRIEGSPQVTAKYDYAYTHLWEANQVSGTTYQYGVTSGNYRATYSWEPSSSADDTVSLRRAMWIYEAVRLWEWGIDAPASAPTLTMGITGYLYAHDWEGEFHATTYSAQFGTTRNTYQCLYDWEQNIAIADGYTYRRLFLWEGESSFNDNSRIGIKYTYCRKSGTALECESNPSSAAYIEANYGVPVTWAFPSDPQVTHVRIYRTLAGGTTFYYAGERKVDLLSTMVITQDTGLGSAVATDHDRILSGAGVVAGPTYNGYCFALKGNLLYFCKPNQPEYWPATYYVEVGPPQEPLKALQLYNGVPYVESEEEVYMIQGSSYDSFFPFAMKAKVGALAQIGTLAIAGYGIARVDVDGLYVFAAGDDKKISQAGFDPIFQGETKGSIPGMNRAKAANCWLLIYDNRLWLGFPAGTATYPNNVLVINLATLRPVHYQFSQEFGAVTVDVTNNRVLALDSTGYVRVLDDSSVTTDDGTSISWQVESKAYVDQLYKYFPRSAKYDVTLNTGATATGNILLSDAVVQTHALTESRKTRKRLIAGSNGDRLGIRLSGTGPVEIREVEVS